MAEAMWGGQARADKPTDDDVYQAYPQLLDMLSAIARPVLLMPLAQMASANEQMQVLGPILDPTRYMRGGGQNLHDQRRVIDAMLELQRVLRSLKPEPTAEAGRG